MDVRLEGADEMNLLGLFMRSALDARRETLDRVQPSGAIAMTAGAMSVTLDFAPDRLTIRKGVDDDARAHVTGSLEALIEVARGSNAPLLRRQAKVSGNPLALLPLSKVFKQTAPDGRSPAREAAA